MSRHRRDGASQRGLDHRGVTPHPVPDATRSMSRAPRDLPRLPTAAFGHQKPHARPSKERHYDQVRGSIEHNPRTDHRATCRSRSNRLEEQTVVLCLPASDWQARTECIKRQFPSRPFIFVDISKTALRSAIDEWEKPYPPESSNRHMCHSVQKAWYAVGFGKIGRFGIAACGEG